MIRLWLVLAGKLSLPMPGTLILVSAIITEPIARNVFFQSPVAVSIWLGGAIFYSAMLAVAMKSKLADEVSTALNQDISRLGATYLYLYCVVVLLLAVLIPGSPGFFDFVCNESPLNCVSKARASEVGLRLLGLSAAMDFVDFKRLRRRMA